MQVTEQKIANLEKQVQSLQKQQTSSVADRFKFNGFISVAYTSSNNNAGYDGIDTSANFYDESKLGFQGTFKISDNTQAVMQLVTRGEDDRDVDAEWAYISHRFDSGIQALAGKLRVPLFYYSDYLDVGYAQPFARPPVEVYNSVPFSSYTGADISYDVDFDNSTLTFQGFGGQSKADNSKLIADMNNLFGANVSWTNLVWTLRGVYGQTSIDGQLNPKLGLKQADINDRKSAFTGISASYDANNIIAVTEWTQINTDGPLADNESAYVTLGYHLGEFTPYVTAASYKTTDNDKRVNNPQYAYAFNYKRTAYSAGVRWDFIDNVALKFDVTYATDFDKTHGGLSGNMVKGPAGDFDDSTTAYTVKIDAVF